MITSLSNKTVKELTKLHQKKYRKDSFLLLDEKMILSAKENGYLKKLLYWGEKPFEFSDTLEVSKEVLDKIAGKQGLSHVGVSSLIEESDRYAGRVLLLDHLQDPLNIGRIMEAALQFGFDSLVLSEECADIYHEKCLDHCMGGIYRLHICHRDLSDEIVKLRKNGYTVYATGLRDNTKELHEVETKEKMAFVLGNEGNGVRKEIMDICDDIMKIDMCNIDSLNVGMAAAIIMYRFALNVSNT